MKLHTIHVVTYIFSYWHQNFMLYVVSLVAIMDLKWSGKGKWLPLCSREIWWCFIWKKFVDFKLVEGYIYVHELMLHIQISVIGGIKFAVLSRLIPNFLTYVCMYTGIIEVENVQKYYNICSNTSYNSCTSTKLVLGSASISVFICSLTSLAIYVYMYIQYVLKLNIMLLHTCSPTLDIKLLTRNFMSSWAVLIRVMRVWRACIARVSPSTPASLDITKSNWRVSGIFDNSSRTYSMSLRLIQSYKNITTEYYACMYTCMMFIFIYLRPNLQKPNIIVHVPNLKCATHIS